MGSRTKGAKEKVEAPHAGLNGRWYSSTNQQKQFSYYCYSVFVLLYVCAQSTKPHSITTINKKFIGDIFNSPY